jgi:hypothetical protein
MEDLSMVGWMLGCPLIIGLKVVGESEGEKKGRGIILSAKAGQKM